MEVEPEPKDHNGTFLVDYSLMIVPFPDAVIILVLTILMIDLIYNTYQEKFKCSAFKKFTHTAAK